MGPAPATRRFTRWTGYGCTTATPPSWTVLNTSCASQRRSSTLLAGQATGAQRQALQALAEDARRARANQPFHAKT